MKTLVGKFWSCQSGATAIEYAMIASLIALVIISGATTVGTNLTATFNDVSNGF